MEYSFKLSVKFVIIEIYFINKMKKLIEVKRRELKI